MAGILFQPRRPASGRDLSLRLLEHYSASVLHRQYHATDLVTVRVDGSR